MSLAPVASSPPGGDHNLLFRRPSAALPGAAAASLSGHDKQSEVMMFPRALVYNDAEVVSDSPCSGSVTAIDSINSITTPRATEASPTKPSNSNRPTMAARPTGRVVLKALEAKEGGENISVRRDSNGGAEFPRDSPISNNVNKDSNRLLLSPSIFSPTASAEAAAAGEISVEGGGNVIPQGVDFGFRGGGGSPMSEAGGATMKGKTSQRKADDESDDDSGTGDNGIKSENRRDHSPVVGSVAPAHAATEPPPDAARPRQGGTTGARGRSMIVRSPPGITPNRRSSHNLRKLSSISSFFQSRRNKNSLCGEVARANTCGSDKSDSAKTVSRMSMCSSAQSYKTGEYDDDMNGVEGASGMNHDEERAKKHWRVLRAVFMALGETTSESEAKHTQDTLQST